MNKNGRSRKSKLIIILTLIVLFIAVICYFFAYKYPIHFLFNDDSVLEYQNEKYIKYTGNKWTFYFGSNYDELIGYGKNLSWRLYTSSYRNSDFILLEYRPIITGRAPLPQIFIMKISNFTNLF